jgi:hypothetical protein
MMCTDIAVRPGVREDQDPDDARQAARLERKRLKREEKEKRRQEKKKMRALLAVNLLDEGQVPTWTPRPDRSNPSYYLFTSWGIKHTGNG